MGPCLSNIHIVLLYTKLCKKEWARNIGIIELCLPDMFYRIFSNLVRPLISADGDFFEI